MRSRVKTPGLWVALAILLAIAFIQYRTTRMMVETAGWLSHTHEVIETIDDLRLSLSQTQSIRRAYALTGDDAALSGYAAASRSSNERLGHLRALTGDNPQQQEELRLLEPRVARHLVLLDASIAERRRGYGAEQEMKSTEEGIASMAAISSVLTDMETEERRLLATRGQHTYQSVTYSIALQIAGTVAGFIILLLGFARLRRALDEVELRRNELDQFFDTSLDLLAISGFDGRFKRINRHWSKLLGWSEAELLEKPLAHLVHPDDRAATMAGGARLRAGISIEHFVNRYLCKDGSYRWLEWKSAPSVERGLIYCAVRDVTERKHEEENRRKTQKQLIVADRMASVGTLAAGMAHEINNPLSYVIANLDMIVEELRALGEGAPPGEQIGQAAELQEMALEAREGAERVKKIVRGLKTFSRADEERRAVIDLRPVLELSVNMLSNEIRQRGKLITEYGATPKVEADDARLGQVFINLLINAAQSLLVEKAETNEIRVVTSTDEAGGAVVEVSDSGPAIPPAALERIFDPFFTTKEVGFGSGLGLSICHSIVTGIGGDISVTSEPGRGTTFRVVIPPAVAQKAPVLAGQAAAPASEAPAAVLIVDDDESVGVVLRRVLRNHEVTLVTRAREALDLIAAGKRFDVILSDMMMPEMSGMDFYEELARRHPEIAERVVFVTGGAFTPAANTFLDRVDNECIDKPFDPAVIRALVQRFVARRAPAKAKEGIKA